MSFAGLRGTGSWGTDERPKNFREGILWYNAAGTAPIFALTSKAKTKSVNDPEFSHWEEKLLPVRIEVDDNSGYTATSTTLTIFAVGLGNGTLKSAGGNALKKGDLLMVEKSEITSYDNEIVEVSSVTNDTTVVVVRGACNTTATGLADNTYFTLVGNRYAEGTAATDIRQRNPTKVYNYTQIFKTSCGATGTAEATEARTGDAFLNDKKRKMFDHMNAIEWAIMFGVRYEDTSSGTFPMRTFGGLRSMITTNVTIFSTSPTETTLLNALSPCFDMTGKDPSAGNQRLLVAGNGWLNNFNRLIQNSSSYRMNYDKVPQKMWGLSFNHFVIPQGEFLVKSHPLMSQHPRFTNSAFIIDPTAITWRPLRGRDTKFEDHIETPGKDSHEGQWLTEGGIEVDGEFTMAYLGNFVI